jgi:hypothetical protein
MVSDLPNRVRVERLTHPGATTTVPFRAGLYPLGEALSAGSSLTAGVLPAGHRESPASRGMRGADFICTSSSPATLALDIMVR